MEIKRLLSSSYESSVTSVNEISDDFEVRSQGVVEMVGEFLLSPHRCGDALVSISVGQ